MSDDAPNWWPKLMRAAEAHGLPVGTALALVKVLHDDGCARLQGTGVCDCDPDVKIMTSEREAPR